MAVIFGFMGSMVVGDLNMVSVLPFPSEDDAPLFVDAARLSAWQGGCNPQPLSPQNLREDVGEDAAGAVVVYFDGGVDADYDGEVEAGAFGQIEFHQKKCCRFPNNHV